MEPQGSASRLAGNSKKRTRKGREFIMKELRLLMIIGFAGVICIIMTGCPKCECEGDLENCRTQSLTEGEINSTCRLNTAKACVGCPPICYHPAGLIQKKYKKCIYTRGIYTGACNDCFDCSCDCGYQHLPPIPCHRRNAELIENCEDKCNYLLGPNQQELFIPC